MLGVSIYLNHLKSYNAHVILRTDNGLLSHTFGPRAAGLLGQFRSPPP
jgi:hypothetical protein